MAVTTVHFASATPHAKCNDGQLEHSMAILGTDDSRLQPTSVGLV